MVKGHHTYKDTTISQHDDVALVFKQLFNQVKPSQVLEIGTLYGGLTLLIRDLLDEVSLNSSDFRSYDILDIPRYYLDESIKNGAKIDLRIKNIFNHVYDNFLPELVDEVESFIKQSGPTIVLCDGGSKKNEFRLLSQFLKPGDIIMAHDYAPNNEYFEAHIKNKIWDWLEIQDSDIQESVETYNLKPFMQEEFQKVVWACKIKE